MLALANSVCIQKWGAAWPTWVVVLIYALALMCLTVGAVRFEHVLKAKGTVVRELGNHPLSTAILFFSVLAVGWYSWSAVSNRRTPTDTQMKAQARPAVTAPASSDGQDQPSRMPPKEAFLKHDTGNTPIAHDAKQPDRIAPGPNSIVQANSGGVNVQQGTVGDNSPIINSPISVGEFPKTIHPSEMDSIEAFLRGFSQKSHIMISADQLSLAPPFTSRLCEAFRDSGWVIEEQCPNGWALIGPKSQRRVVVIEYGDPVANGEQVHLGPNDPAIPVLMVLKKLGESPSLRRTKVRLLPGGLPLDDKPYPTNLITIDFSGGFTSPNE